MGPKLSEQYYVMYLSVVWLIIMGEPILLNITFLVKKLLKLKLNSVLIIKFIYQKRKYI